MKNLLTKLTLSLMALLATFSIASAQTTYENPKGIFDYGIGNKQPFLYMTLNYNQTNGIGDFGKNTHIQAPGVGLNIGVLLNEIPIGVGLNMGFQMYDMMNRPSPYYNRYREELTSGYNFFMPSIRTQSVFGPITPYLEASAGLVWAYSSLNMHYDDNWDNWEDEHYDDESDYLHNDFTWGASIGAGVMIKLVSFGNGGLNLDLNARYGMGGDIEYAKENSFFYENGGISYDLVKSPLKFYSFGAGFSVVL